MNKKYHILPILTLLCLLISIVLFFFEGSINTKEYLEKSQYSQIQKNIDEVSLNLKNEVSRAVEHLMAGDIKEFKSKTSVFYLQNGRVSHWTDYHLPYHQSFSEGSKSWSLVKNKQGMFLVYKQNIINYNSFNQIVGVVDFYRDYHLSSDYLLDGFNPLIFNNYQVEASNAKDAKSLLVDNIEIWKYKVIAFEQFSLWIKVLWFILFLVGVLSLLLYVLLFVFYLNKKSKYYFGFFLLLLFLFTIRGLMIYFHFPHAFYDFKLFDPTVFASSNINASFGDLLLNILCIVALVVYAYFWLIKFSVNLKLMKLSIQKKRVIAVLLTFFVFSMSIWIQQIFKSIYQNSQVNFDITESLHFDINDLIYIIIFCCLISGFFLFNHFVLKALNIILSRNKKLIVIHFLVQGLISCLICYYVFDKIVWLPFLVFLYLCASIIFDLFQNVRNFLYKTYLYFTLSAMVFGLIVSFTIVEETERKDLAFKKRFAEQLTLHNDIQGEVIMSEIADHVKKDELIASNLNNGFVKKEVIEERVRERYLGNYFDKYEVHFSYYNKAGMPYYSNELSGNLKQVKSGIINEEVDTWVSNLFFVTNFKKDFYSIYYHFIDLEFDGKYVGTIVIDYTLKKYISKSILPSLLRLSSVDGYKNIEQYNYAIYNGNELQYSVGDFNYNSPEFEVLLRNKSLQGKDFKIDGFNHYLDFGVGDKMIIVSSRINKFYKLLTNFSFHFLLVVFLLLVLLVLSSISYFIKNKSSDFSTKIQTYMNMSTFAPMIILSVLILGLMASSYRKDQEFQFRNNAEILSSHVLGYLEEFKEQKIGLYELKSSIEKLSKYSGSDINIYDTSGELVISNQSLLFEAGVMSNLINPKASKQIFEMKHRLVELEENIGAFSYNTVYVALTTPETSEFMGVMSIPFFNSSKQMEAKKISALSIIINVFAIAFVLLLGVSFFVTKSLTSPLRLIANKLRKVETGSKNEPLYWDSNDELGLLISEYNLMLQKIEESKQTFAQSQKESAWKEMAQQVAHEIKNPLTPMKLKLQHLKRVLGESDDRANDAIDSLLDQVDTLSEIASSFSSFAKMPMPESKKINLSEVCQHVLSLYESTAEYSVNGELELNLKVLGDDKLIGRVLTNLILNGIESVPNDRIPDVAVNLKRNGKKIILSVSDNGVGIPKEIQSKVFVPNFTTKYSGSGIGLAVAKNGIEQMGGKIWFETKENEGTIFFIELSSI